MFNEFGLLKFLVAYEVESTSGFAFHICRKYWYSNIIILYVCLCTMYAWCFSTTWTKIITLLFYFMNNAKPVAHNDRIQNSADNRWNSVNLDLKYFVYVLHNILGFMRFNIFFFFSVNNIYVCIWQTLYK